MISTDWLLNRKLTGTQTNDLVLDFTPRIENFSVLLKFRSAREDVRVRLYRNGALLFESVLYSTEPHYFFDQKVTHGQNIIYHLELFDAVYQEYQIVQQSILVPMQAPNGPRNLELGVEILSEGFKRRATITWNYDAQKEYALNPSGFELTSNLLDRPIYIDVNYYSYSYEYSFTSNKDIQNVTVSLRGYRDSYVSSSGQKLTTPIRLFSDAITDEQTIERFYSLPTPVVTISDGALIYSGLDLTLVDGIRPGYTFDVTATVPNYTREIDGFEIQAEYSNSFKGKTYVPVTTTNTLVFTETNIPINRVPSYTIRAYVDVLVNSAMERRYSKSVTITASAITQTISDFNDLLADSYTRGENNTSFPTALGIPAIVIHYNGDNLITWIDNEVGRLGVPVSQGTATVRTTYSSSPDADTLEMINGIVWKYARQEDGSFVWTRLDALLTPEEKSPGYTYIVAATSVQGTSYYQWDNNAEQWRDYKEMFKSILSTTVKNAIQQVYGTTTLPDMVNSVEVAEVIDSFMLNRYIPYGLSPRVFDGPVIAFRGSPTLYLPPANNPFDEDVLVPQASRVRVGPETFTYGALTGIERISDVVSRINAVGRGYIADTVIDAAVNGGELEVEFGDLSYNGELPSTSALASNKNIIFYSYEELTNGTTWYKGRVKPEWLKEFLKDGNKVTVEANPDHVTTDRTVHGGYIVRFGKMMARRLERTRIRLLPPYADNPTLPWYPRVDPGIFDAYFGSEKVTYTLPEYAMQTWSPKYGQPFKSMTGERAAIVDRHVIRSSRYPLAYDHPDVLLTVNDQDWTAKIIDYDYENGLIFLDTDLPIKSVPQISYVYEERSFVYPFINLNPSIGWNNEALSDKLVALFMVPVGTTVTEQMFGQDRVLYHRVFDKVEDILAFQYDNDICDDPRKVFLLGYYHIGAGKPEDVQITDARKRGGGLREDLTFDAAFRIHPGVVGYYDIGYHDGAPFPNTVCLVKLPKYVQERFTQEQIMQAVTKHLAFGIMPIIEYVDDQHVRHNDPDSRIIFPLSTELTEPEFGIAFGESLGMR